MDNKILIAVIALLTVVSVFGIISINTAPKKIIYEEAAQETAGFKKPAVMPAPEFLLKDLGGAETKLSDLKGKVIILDFWATWCPPCRAEIPHFISLYDQYRNKGLEIIGIAMDNNPKRVLPDFIKDNGISYPILLGHQDVYDLYGGIPVLPTTFIIDKEGNVRKKYIGYNEKEAFEKAVKELL
ncbi:MAG: TlpA disulfide reductase family protein [Candidatus Omnitrophota bacterium]|nr:TlpA disulfide reductase family protein [Candidatus Omnitrophota bacterium]